MFTKFLILSSLSLVVNCVVFDMVYSMRYVDGIRVLRICSWNGEGLLNDEDLIFQLKVQIVPYDLKSVTIRFQKSTFFIPYT